MSDEQKPKELAVHVYIGEQEFTYYLGGMPMVGEQGPEKIYIPDGAKIIPVEGYSYLIEKPEEKPEGSEE